MDRGGRGMDIITLRFEIRENFPGFHQYPPTRKSRGLAPGISPPAEAKIALFTKVQPRTNILALFAKVRKRYACAAHFKSKCCEMAMKCTLCGKVPFLAIGAPGRG